MKKKKRKKIGKRKQREARGESTQVSLFWFALWVNYQNFNVITKAAMNLIPFSCMLRTFHNDEDVVLPASLLSHCGRVISIGHSNRTNSFPKSTKDATKFGGSSFKSNKRGFC